MKSFVAALAFSGAASASVLKRDSNCCFEITASGSPSGTLGQLDDGQNRVGGNLGAATYCLDNGEITDASGRGCILTPPTTQFQCDKGATPTSGFSISSEGNIEYKGDSTFYACGATQKEYNIYTTPVEDQADCHKVTLMVGNVKGQCPLKSASSSMASSTAPAKTVTVTNTATTTVTGKASTETVTHEQTKTKVSTAVSTISMCTATSVFSKCSATEHMTKTESACTATSVNSMCTATTTVTLAKSQPASSKGSATATTTVTQLPSQPASSKMQTYPASKPAMSTKSKGSATATQTASGSVCQTSLTGAYETPHLIVPVNSEHPDTAYGTQYNGKMSDSISTIFNFDIPQSYAGKQCTVIFLFPEQKDLVTSSFTFNNKGSLDFCELSSPATQQTTYKNQAECKKDLGSVAVMPGNSYVVSSGPCAAGMKEAIEVKSEGGLDLEYFQDWNPSPIGMYITAC